MSLVIYCLFLTILFCVFYVAVAPLLLDCKYSIFFDIIAFSALFPFAFLSADATPLQRPTNTTP